MAYNVSKHIFSGMGQDLSDDKKKYQTHYIDAHNIRITAREDTTLLSVTNEKGNLRILDEYSFGTYVGHAVLNDYLILFTFTLTDQPGSIERIHTDLITRINLKATPITVTTLYSGNLGFDINHPIETLVDFETEEIQKVYWTDGINQPRVINIKKEDYRSNDDTQFDFVRQVFSLGNSSTIPVGTVNKDFGNGIFKAGTIQYFITYFDKFSQETNVVWQSSLYYISPYERGGSPTETIDNKFRLEFSNLNTLFEYMRLYSIQHTSEDTAVTCRRIIDLKIPSSGELEYVDTGAEGENISPEELFYKGGIPVAIGTFTQKDGVLFLGNIKIKQNTVPQGVINFFKNNVYVTYDINGGTLINSDNASGLLYGYTNQLNESNSIRTFKYLETYRFGVQFQDTQGNWSDPVYIGDYQNDKAPFIQGGTTRLPKAVIHIPTASTTDWIQLLADNGFINVRPVIVLPREFERECVAQGVLCPTVYNKKDREENAPFAQPSWFFRPYPPVVMDNNQIVDDIDELNTGINHNNGNIIPYQHNDSIRGKTTLGEIQSAPATSLSPFRDSINIGDEEFFIDSSIVTLNSPDIDLVENSLNLDCSQLAFRIVGVLNLTGNSGYTFIDASAPSPYFIQDETGTVFNMGRVIKGNLDYPLSINNYSNNGWKLMTNGPYYADIPYHYFTDSLENHYFYPGNTAYGYIIYPWHSTGSLASLPSIFDEDVQGLEGHYYRQSSILNKKVCANLRYSRASYYLDSVLSLDSTDIQVVDPNVKSTVVLNTFKNNHRSHYANDNGILYYSDIDKILPSSEEGFDTYITQSNHRFSNTAVPGDVEADLKDFNYQPLSSIYSGLLDTALSESLKKKTGTSITYKNGRHIVISLEDSEFDLSEGEADVPTLVKGTTILPRINNVGKCKGYYSPFTSPDYCQVSGKYFWDSSSHIHSYIVQNNIIDTHVTDYGTLLIGEIYRPSIENKFGGTSEEALQNNTWIPAGTVQSLSNIDNITWTEGDTYFQRYDCLKTYPYSNENENNIVEILSFMCESRINIAGRYDSNRGLKDNTLITNENFNLVNKVYNQKNNFFNYKILDDRFKLQNFNNQITWTRVKSAGSIVDNWTTVTLANTLDLDGDKGEIVSLQKFNDNIIAFQPKGIATIGFNENVQISTENNTPIELANSGRVTGKKYSFEGLGCQNKWSINNESNGYIYFIDNYNKGIYKLGGREGIVNLIDTKGFRAWMEKINSTESWIPYTQAQGYMDFHKAFRTFYDKGFKDVYFVNGSTCLVYSESLDEFVSFMDYHATNAMFNVGDSFYALYNNPTMLYKQFAGEYNKIYDTFRDYDITFIHNEHPELSKIYTNLDFRSDTYNNSNLSSFETFNKIQIFNEYQDSGIVELERLLGRPSRLQKKFRIWRVQLPRDKDNTKDRIRNTWTKIKLSKMHPSQPPEGVTNTENLILHDAVVGYYI